MILKKKLAVLGATGFIGSNILKCLDQFDVASYMRSKLDFNNPATFKNFKENNVTIIDCITQTDRSQEAMKTNFIGLREFINYLQERGSEFNYIYFSSLSTLDRDLCEKSLYVKSKFLAEVFLEETLPDYKIIRLTYPFGNRQNEDRLLPRLARKILRGDWLEINSCPIHLTPIDWFSRDFMNLVLDEQEIINYVVTPSITLRQVCELLAAEFHKPLNFVETDCVAPFFIEGRSGSYSYDQLVRALVTYANTLAVNYL
jgi:nucleoside-diphosphate-sugar epimerase